MGNLRAANNEWNLVVGDFHGRFAVKADIGWIVGWDEIRISLFYM